MKEFGSSGKLLVFLKVSLLKAIHGFHQPISFLMDLHTFNAKDWKPRVLFVPVKFGLGFSFPNGDQWRRCRGQGADLVARGVPSLWEWLFFVWSRSLDPLSRVHGCLRVCSNQFKIFNLSRSLMNSAGYKCTTFRVRVFSELLVSTRYRKTLKGKQKQWTDSNTELAILLQKRRRKRRPNRMTIHCRDL